MKRFWLSLFCMINTVLYAYSLAQLNIMITEGVDNATPIAVMPF